MSGRAELPATLAGRRFLIGGRVQRVGFRAATRRRALALGLAGYARNLPDGRVEVVACGDPQAITELLGWLQRGPALARVDSVEDVGQGEAPPGPFRAV